MHTLYTVLATLAIAAGIVGTLTIVTFLLAGGANSSPEQIRQIKWWILATVVGGLICLGLGTLLVFKAHPLWGGLVGAVPFVFVFASIIWLQISRTFF